MNITALLHININCSDFERSQTFYEMLGFKILMPVPAEGTGDVAAAVGMTSYTVQGALMRHPSGPIIDLLQWQQLNGTTTRFICFKDPDGTVLELVDMGAS